MAPIPSSDEQHDNASGDESDAIDDRQPFNALTGDLNDLRLTHDHCWLWPQLTAEFDRLDHVVENARTFLEPLTEYSNADWVQQAVLGMARSHDAVYQHAEQHGSYVIAARSLWTTRIPSEPPTLTDAQILALLSIHEARRSAETYCEIAAGIEEDMELTSISHDDEDSIGWLRSELAGWERVLWRDAAEQTGIAEQFLLMASFATNVSAVALKKAESQMATLRRKASVAAAIAAPYRKGRSQGAVSHLTRALMELVKEAESTELSVILDMIEEYFDGDVQGIRFTDIVNDRVFYIDTYKNIERSIATDSLKRKLQQLPDV